MAIDGGALSKITEYGSSAFFSQTSPEDTVQSKRFVIITHALKNTLGDPSFAVKLQKTLLDNQNKMNFKVKITVIVDTSQCDNTEAVKRLFAFHGGDYILVESLDKAYGSSKNNNVKDCLNNADLIILSPTTYCITDDTATVINETKRPVLLLTEYDFDIEFHGRYFSIPAGAIYQSTGLSQNSLGIYCDIPLSSSNTNDLQVHADDQCKLPNVLDSREFFFGYFNKNCKTYNGAAPSNFIVFSVYASKGKFVDIILPLLSSESKPGNNYSKELFCSTEFIETLLAQKDKVLLSYSNSAVNGEGDFFLYEKKNGKVTYRKIDENEFGEHHNFVDNVVRIVNPFPLHPQSVMVLMRAAHPVSMTTGDQSFSESLSLSKIPFYQCMGWKRNVYTALILGTQDYVNLNKWVRMLEQQTCSMQELAQFYSDNSSSLKEEMNSFTKKLCDSKNLESNLLQLVNRVASDDVMLKFRIFVEQFVENQEYYADGTENSNRIVTIQTYAKHVEFYLQQVDLEMQDEMIAYLDKYAGRVNFPLNDVYKAGCQLAM